MTLQSAQAERVARQPAEQTRAIKVKPRLSQRIYDLVGLVGVGMLAVLAAFAIAPQLFTPYDPAEMVGRPFLEPSGDHLLGTNDIGQDLFSEIIYGTRASLSTGLSVSVLAITIGVVAGLLSGYYSNLLSSIILMLTDLVLVLPFLPLVILLGAYLGQGQRNIILILVLVSWAIPARLIRSRVLAVINTPYVEAARALGSGDGQIILRHVWPAVRALALVQFVMLAAATILAEASLSFLGLGDPATKSWGTTLYFARSSGVFLSEAWKWWVVPAGLMISLSILSLVLIAYALERRLEPGLR